MFRNRTNSQKPADELYAAFKQNFPGVRADTATSSAAASRSTNSVSEGIADPALIQSKPFEEVVEDEAKPLDATPRGSLEPWRFTPSLLDPNTFSFSSFANQPGYYTPTPGGMNTVYHNQAGDLHTPGMTFHLGTPLSMSVPDGSLPSNQSFSYMHGFHPQMFHTQPFLPQSNLFQQPQSFAPSLLVHQDSGYEAMDGITPENDPSISPALQRGMHSSTSIPTQGFDGSMAAPAPPFPNADKYGFSAEEIWGQPTDQDQRFRFHVTLNAPTAMIREADEIPVTYLNKGQAYTMSIFDNVPQQQATNPVKYRTVVRISFEDEQQRQRPSACWQLWKEGRGLAEAHQRGGKLQAVEYVDSHPGGEDDIRRTRVELDRASFDSFSVIWTPAMNTNNAAECSVAVRFNFLSTDFSHSKGVKGIPVRLCAKTEILHNDSTDSSTATVSEVCFCKVKLFRDHGAERKLSNDVAHVKKTIDKLKQQITQVESGMKDFGKRKRSGSRTGGERPTKVHKHKRTWSVSSQSSTGRPAMEEDLHQKLATYQDMFTSTRPVSVLYLKGLEEDDPDVYPVSLPGKNIDVIPGPQRRDSQRRDEASPVSSGQMSPTQSSRSAPSKERNLDQSPYDQLTRPRPRPSTSHESKNEFSSSTMATPDTPSGAMRIQRTGSGFESESIEALGVDSSYLPPPERTVKPVACFYVLIKLAGKEPEDDYYRAVYLLNRTLLALVQNITAKCGIDSTRVDRTLRINSRGLKIVVDDEVVRELPEGQDMKVEFTEMNSAPNVKEEQDAKTSDNPASRVHETSGQSRLEMKLFF